MESRYDLIERYLTDEMSVKEQTKFEELLRNDSDLMREFTLRKKIDNAITEDDIIDLRSSLDSIINKKPSISRKIKKPAFYSSVAAVIVLIVVFTGIRILPSKNQEGTEFFQSYYMPYSSIMISRSSVNQSKTEEILYKAFSFYDEGKYKLASDHFHEVLILDDNNYMSQFYFSICEIEKNNLKNAKCYLNDLVLNENHVFVEQANWYLALVYLKQDNLIEANKILTKIVCENMIHKADAKAIIKELN